MPLYIEKLMVTSTDQPTDQPTDQQGEYRAICLFLKLENRKKAEICNLGQQFVTMRIYMKMRENYSIHKRIVAYWLLGHYTILGHWSEIILVQKQPRK